MLGWWLDNVINQEETTSQIKIVWTATNQISIDDSHF